MGQTIALCRLLGWAFRPRNFMKNPPRRTNLEQMANRRRGFSTLSRSRGLARLDRPREAMVCPTIPFVVLRPDRRPDYHMRQFPRVGQGDMIPAGIVGRDPGPPGGVARRADGSHTGLPPCRQPVGRGEHLQLHAPVPGEGRAPLQPHHGDLQPPAPQSISVDERPIVPAARVQVSVFPRLPQARPLATVHAGLSAGSRDNCSPSFARMDRPEACPTPLPRGSGGGLRAGPSICA